MGNIIEHHRIILRASVNLKWFFKVQGQIDCLETRTPLTTLRILRWRSAVYFLMKPSITKFFRDFMWYISDTPFELPALAISIFTSALFFFNFQSPWFQSILKIVNSNTVVFSCFEDNISLYLQIGHFCHFIELHLNGVRQSLWLKGDAFQINKLSIKFSFI